MFYSLPTCPEHKKCRCFSAAQIGAKTTQKAARRLVYPSAPEVDHRMQESTLTMLANHQRVCEMYFRENLSYFVIATTLDVPAHTVRNYLDKYVKGRERYE